MCGGKIADVSDRGRNPEGSTWQALGAKLPGDAYKPAQLAAIARELAAVVPGKLVRWQVNVGAWGAFIAARVRATRGGALDWYTRQL